MSLVQYVPSDTLLHRLDPRTKLALIPFVIVIAFILSALVPLLILTLVILGAWLYVRAPFSYLRKMLIVLISLVVFITIIQGLFYAQRSSTYGTGNIFSRNESAAPVPAERAILVDLLPSVLRRVGFIERAFGSSEQPDRALVLYTDGVVFGLTLGLRLACIVLIMPLITMTTSLTDLMLALAKLRIPWKIAYLVVTSFRFVPVLMDQVDTILSAQQLRGLDVEKANVIKRMTAYAPLAVPVILGAFRNSEQLEMVLSVRGFTADIRSRTTLYEIAWTQKDTIAITLMIVGILVAIVLRVMMGAWP